MFRHGLAWHQKMPKKSAFQQSQRWYELHKQIFENSKFLGDFTIVFRFILFTLFDISLSLRRLGTNWNKNPLEINVLLYIYIYIYIYIYMYVFMYDCDSLHARLNSHYNEWSYKKKKQKNIKAFRLICAYWL